METDDILKLAASHDLHLKDDLSFNEMGIDFKVVFAETLEGKKWVLRIPRRPNLGDQIEREKKILHFVRPYLSVDVPDWKIADSGLVAYPLLKEAPVLTFDAVTHEVSWNIDLQNNQYTASLAQLLVQLHQIPVSEAASQGLRRLSPQEARQEIADNIKYVKGEMVIRAELETLWQQWVDTDSLWPDFSTFVHGDLYAGHVLSDGEGHVRGVIDWSEAHISDPSIDFAGHLTVFGEEGLQELLLNYEKCGGRVWDNILEHTRRRQSAAPLKYALFALQVGMDEHIRAARDQLGSPS